MRAAFWWIDRWRKSTAYTDMRLAEQGAYRNLLDELWLRDDGTLPDDDRILGKISGDSTQWRKVREKVLAHFYKVPGGWRNKTHDEVAAWPESQRAKGRRRAADAERDRGRFAPAEHQPEHQPEDQPNTSRRTSR